MEDSRLSLVENISEVLENIKTFNEELPQSKHLMRKLSSFKQWYYSEELNLFAPSMFIGYKQNTAADYEKGTLSSVRYIHGWDTEAILKQWSIEAKGLDYIELEEKLSSLLEEYDKKIKANARINILCRLTNI
jgi:hypothetical protein